MQFSAILAAFYDECNYASSPASAVVTRAKRFVNEGVRVILGEPGLSRMVDNDSPATFASVASTARYVLPAAVDTILHITERTNDLALLPMPLAEYRLLDPDAISTTGTPVRYVPIGRVAVATQPSNASAIFVKSTAGGDTTQVCYIEGSRGDYFTGDSVTLTGATAVQIGSGTDWTEITDLYLSAVGVGTITVHEDSGIGTELARIFIGTFRPRHYGIYLWPTPAAAVTYYVDYRRNIQDLVNDTDEPLIPLDMHPMLVAYAVMREAEKTGNDVLLAQAGRRYQRFMDNLKYKTQLLADELPVVGRYREPRRRFRDRATFPLA